MSIIDILMGIPSGSLCGGERVWCINHSKKKWKIMQHFQAIITSFLAHGYDVVIPWGTSLCFWRHCNSTQSLGHSLTQSFTHSILINLFIKLGTNILLLPPLLIIAFVPSALWTYMYVLQPTNQHCFQSTWYTV